MANLLRIEVSRSSFYAPLSQINHESPALMPKQEDSTLNCGIKVSKLANISKIHKLVNSNMAEVKLFGFWPSPFSYRVIWALKLKGVNYEYIEEKLADKSALLLQYNPVYKKMPVLVHAGRPIAESNIILQYIEETWPENPLLPKDPYEKAQAMFWMKFPEDKLLMMQTMSFSFFVTTGDEQEKAVKDCLETLGVVEEHGIGDNKFFAGDSIGLVDLSFGIIAYWLGIMEEAAGMKVLDPHLFPRLHRWTENFKEVPVIRENLPEHDAALAYFKGRRETFITSGHKH